MICGPEVTVTNMDVFLCMKVFLCVNTMHRIDMHVPWREQMKNNACTIADISSSNVISHTYSKKMQFASFSSSYE